MLYERPFRVLQFDTVTTAKNPGKLTGARYILTVIDCFSRWCWLIPIVDQKAEIIAEALLKKVFCDIACFPAVL